MAKDKNTILVYADWIQMFDDLEDAEAGRLIKHFFRYVNDLNPEPPDRLTNLLFKPIKIILKRDLKTYEAKCLKNQETAKKRWGKEHPTVSDSKEVEIKATDIEQEVDSGKEKGKEEEVIEETPNPPKAKKADSNKIDFQKLGEYYNTKLCPPLPTIMMPMSVGRKAVVTARAKEHGKQSVKDMLELVGQSSFLMGKNDNNWRASFDWLFKPTNFLKVLEGNYTDTEATDLRSKKQSAVQMAEKASLARQKQNEEHLQKLDQNAKNAVLPPKDLSILKHIK